MQLTCITCVFVCLSVLFLVTVETEQLEQLFAAAETKSLTLGSAGARALYYIMFCFLYRYVLSSVIMCVVDCMLCFYV